MSVSGTAQPNARAVWRRATTTQQSVELDNARRSCAHPRDSVGGFELLSCLLLQNILLTKNFESAKVSDVGLAR